MNGSNNNNANILTLWENRKQENADVVDNLTSIAQTVLKICCFGGSNKSEAKALTAAVQNIINELIEIKILRDRLSGLPAKARKEFSASFQELQKIPSFEKLIKNWDDYFASAVGKRIIYVQFFRYNYLSSHRICASGKSRRHRGRT